MSSPFAEPAGEVETEYGGMPGLVQPLEKGHELTPSERIGLVYRASHDAAAIDPVTGLSALQE